MHLQCPQKRKVTWNQYEAVRWVVHYIKVHVPLPDYFTNAITVSRVDVGRSLLLSYALPHDYFTKANLVARTATAPV
jgi:hypothetical protein